MDSVIDEALEVLDLFGLTDGESPADELAALAEREGWDYACLTPGE